MGKLYKLSYSGPYGNIQIEIEKRDSLFSNTEAERCWCSGSCFTEAGGRSRVREAEAKEPGKQINPALVNAKSSYVPDFYLALLYKPVSLFATSLMYFPPDLLTCIS